MRICLIYEPVTGRVETEIYLGSKGYNTDALDDMCKRAGNVHRETMDKAAVLWTTETVDADVVVTEDVEP